jgi:hypothetical protein
MTAPRRRPFALPAALALAAALLVPAVPAFAQDISYRGWGVRAGVSDDPDQFVVGVQFDMGRFLDALRFRPAVDLGFGDDHTILSGIVPVHWVWNLESRLDAYAGGGVTLSWIDRDLPRRDDSEFEIGPVLVGGLEWPVGASQAGLELAVQGGDLPDAKLVVFWNF